MSETTPSGYTGGGTSDHPDEPTLTGAGGGAGTAGRSPADGKHPQAPAPTERDDDQSATGRRNP